MPSVSDSSSEPSLSSRKVFPVRLGALLRMCFSQSPLPATGAIAIQACGVLHRDQAILLASTSALVRHTFASLWRTYRPSFPVLSERCMIIRPDGNRFLAFADPSEESGGSPSWIPACLGVIFFLEFAPLTSIVPLSHARALARLIASSTLPYPSLPLTHTGLSTARKVAMQIPCAQFFFHPDRDALIRAASWVA